MEWHCWIVLLLQFSVVAFRANVTASKDPNEKRLSFLQQSKCTYSYELAVHTARGSKSTESDGFQVHALVDITAVSRENEAGTPVHLYKLDIREPRLRRVLYGRVLNNYPVNEEFEEQLSKPFYFRQKEHGPVMEVLFPKTKESPEIAAFKKGIAGSFQLNLKDAHKHSYYDVQEHDDSGIFRTKYKVMSANDTHAHLHRTWTNVDYRKFADGTPAKAEHKVQSEHSAHVHLKDGRVEKVERTTRAQFKPAHEHPRAENMKDFKKQDIEISSSGYSKLVLRSCFGTQSHRSKRSTVEKRHDFKYLTSDSLVFDDTEKIKWSKIGGEKKKRRPLHEVLRCFVDKSVKEREVGYCTKELHNMIQSDQGAFREVKRLVQNRNHQNLTSWTVYVGALAANGGGEAQVALADAVKTDSPRPLTSEEYEALLLSIFYLPEGPLHCDLVNAILDLTLKDEKGEDITDTAMLVLAGLAKRAQKAGYNDSLSDSVAELIHHRYRNRSSLYHPDSDEYESHLRVHIWAFGNLGHHSGFPVILQHIDHDNSDIRSGVISAMRKLSPQYTDSHLLNALYHDEHSEVKAAVVNVFIHRHQELTDSVVQGLEHAMWHAVKDEALDCSIQEFLENHGNHTKAVYLRTTRNFIHRRKRALFPVLRPREYTLGRGKRWHKGLGGQWLGAETGMQFLNKLQLQVGLFGGKFEVIFDNYAFIRGHILTIPFDVVNGKAAFKAAASFKNDFPKDLIHNFADVGDELLRQFDSITSVITEQIAKFKEKLVGLLPIKIDKFVEFVGKIDRFLKDLALPLQALKGTSKIISFSKILSLRMNQWASLMDRSKRIQEKFVTLTDLDAVLLKALGTMDTILHFIDDISKYLPHDLPEDFIINNLLQTLQKVTVKQQTNEIMEYFMAIRSTVPDGFRLQFPFKFSIYFAGSLNTFQEVLTRLYRFSDGFVEMTSLLDTLAGTHLPELSLPFLKPHSPKYQGRMFNFGLGFHWRVSLKFDLNLKSQDFQEFLALLKNVGDFFSHFKLPDFDLETFSREIFPWGKFDLRVKFPLVLKGVNVNSSDPSDLLRGFISRISDILDLHLLNVSAISHMTDFFRELGPAVSQFAEQNIQKTCRIHEVALKFSSTFKEFGENAEIKGIHPLQDMLNTTQNVLLELLNLTVILDNSLDTMKGNFAASSASLVSNSLRDVTDKMKGIQSLADDVASFLNGTSLKMNGACTNSSAFAADVIDEVQTNARQTLNDLASVTGPVTANIRTAGIELKLAVTEVERWHKENLAARVGKMSRVSQLVRDFISIINSKEGFGDTVRDISTRLNEVLEELQQLPQYAEKARRTADEVTNFAKDAQNYMKNIAKLDLRKQFEVDFDQRIKKVCTDFSAVRATSLSKIRGFDFVDQFQEFSRNGAAILLNRSLPKFKGLKDSVREMEQEIRNFKILVNDMIVVFQDLKPFTSSFAPILDTARKLPDCQEMKKLFLSSTKPCFRKAIEVGGYIKDQYQDFKSDLAVLNELIPETWKNFRPQRCVKSVTCISKVFIEQGKVVRNKVIAVKDKLEKASEYTDLLSNCKEGVNNITQVLDNMKLLMEQVRNISFQGDFIKIDKILKKITGRKLNDQDPGVRVKVRKRSLREEKTDFKRIADYQIKAKELESKIRDFQITTFNSLRSVYDEAVLRYLQSLKSLRSQLKTSYQLWGTTKKFDSSLKLLDNGTKSALAFAGMVGDVTSLFSNPVAIILAEIKDFDDVIKPHLDKNVPSVTKGIDQVNNFLDKVSNFLDTIQTRQRGLSAGAYKPWQDISYCSEEVCLRSLRRSSSTYLSEIFTWKFPHLDDLSSMPKSGRWPTPGLFDDYKVEGITQLSDNEMILGMHGVASNKGKASLLVVTNFDRGVKKIILLAKQGAPLNVKIGGVALANDYIWISDSDGNGILSVRKDHITSTLSSPQPSKVNIYKTVSVEGKAGSVSYDQQHNFLWVTDGIQGKAYGYKLSSNGDLALAGIAPDRVINIGKDAQGMTIVRQFGKEYVCISRCALIAGFQCKLEFHDLSRGDETGENTMARVVRTPSGLESVTRVDNEVIAVAFSSGTLSEKENVEVMGGDFEDRYFKLRLPILSTTFSVNENCLYFKVVFDYVIRPRRIFPVGNMICGTSRKRSTSKQLLETDVYHENLEIIHEDRKRVRRTTRGPDSCFSHRGTLLRGFHEFYRYRTVILVFGIPVILTAGVTGHYSVGFQGSLCLANRNFALGLIPGAWVTAYAGASVNLIVLEVGVTVEARILETYLVPELRISFQRWPLSACLELRLLMTPLSIRVYLWYRFAHIYIKCWLFGCRIGFRWGSMRTFKEWSWSAHQIDRVLFTNCEDNIDRTPPMAGRCRARQVADTKYFVQWDGFKEDTQINAYQVMIGSIKGSGDDYSSWVGASLSKVVTSLKIMHGRDVFVSVMATNDAGIDSTLAFCPLFQARRKGPKIRFVFDGSERGKDDEYQLNTFSIGMNFAFKSDFSEVVSLKWGVSSNRPCTFDESEADIVPLTSLGDSNSIQVSGLKLEHGKKYFTRLYAMDTFGLETVMCSNGIMIDRTPPLPTYFQDGAGEGDINFTLSLKRVRGKFHSFVDPESPIVKYEWKIVKKETDEDITGYVNVPLTQRTPLIEGLSLKSGVSYKLVLRGTNAVGLQAVIETNGFIPDNTPLVCEGKVIDVTSASDTSDFDFVQVLNSIQAKWRCFDPESGIRSQLVGLGTYPGGVDIRSFEEVGLLSQIKMEDGMSYVQFSNITINERIRYYVTVKIINGAGRKRTVYSDGIMIDVTSPTVSPTYIRDGLRGKDTNYSSEQFSFSAHWQQAFMDAESGIDEFRVGLGTKPGLADIKAFTAVSSKNNVTITGILLVSGQRYFVTVVGCNGVGMCVNGSSNGAIVDFVPPHSGRVITGLSGPPTLYQWENKAVWARWNWCLADEKRLQPFLNLSQCTNDSFYDIHTGIRMFGISVMSQKTDQLLTPFKKAGRQRFGNRIVNLQDGIYSVAIEASDQAGLSVRGLSNSFVVDSSPPAIKLLQHGHYGETIAYTNASSISFRSYFMVEDNVSKIKAYKIGVGSYPGADDIIKLQPHSLTLLKTSIQANWTSPMQTSLKNNQRYFITLLAINSAGLFTIKSSASLLADFDPPVNGVIFDGWGPQDARFQSVTSLFRGHWYGFTDFSGIEKVFMGLGNKSVSSECDFRKEEIVRLNTNFHMLSGLSMISGQRYYACLKLVDRAGNFAFFLSNGVLVDSTPPRPGYVTDGKPGLDIDLQINDVVLTASWANFTDPETTILSYQLAFGSFLGGNDVQEFTNVGNVTTAMSSTLKVSKLKTGIRYYATVIAYNFLGIPSIKVSSNGVLVDVTAPFFSQPTRDGDDHINDLNYTSVNTLKATWKCEDSEAGLSKVEIAFGLQPGDTDVMNFRSLPVDQTSFIINYKLRLSHRYFASVRCTNNVGLTTFSFSDGVVYDDTPPVPLYVQDGHYQDSNKTVFVTFMFIDAESSIQAYRIKIWRGPLNNSSIIASFSFDGNVTKATLDLSEELGNGKTYYINVTAVNNVGLESTSKSDGFAVDTTSPVCSKVWDGKSHYFNDMEYASSSNEFAISWDCHDSESSVVQLRLAIKDLQRDEYVVPFYIFEAPFNLSGTAVITGNGRILFKLEEGYRYASGIEVVNAVGLNATYWTNGVVIDSTPPFVRNLKLQFYPEKDVLSAEWLVFDDESGLRSLFWGLGTTPETNDIRNFTEIKPSKQKISVSSSSYRHGVICFLNVYVLNKAGSSSQSSSNGIVIDRSPPNPGIVNAYYTFPNSFNQSLNTVRNSSFAVTWTGFTDSESGIKKTAWAVGTDCQKLKQKSMDMYSEVAVEDSVGGFIIGNQTLVGNKTYFVAVRVTNGAGLSRTECSPGILVILGKLSAGVVSDGPITQENDIDFQLNDKAIWAHWHEFKDPLFGIARYEWCIRDLPPKPNGPGPCAWPYMDVHHLKTKASRFYNLTLIHGRKYYVTVKAENTKGDTVMSSSDGVLVDRTPPIGKSLQISPSFGKETFFITSSSPPVVTWTIDDIESGISHFLVGVGSFPFQSDLLASQRVDSLSRSLDLDQVNLTLTEGLMFYVSVTGVNMLGLETTLTSKQIVVDWTPPKSGKVLDGNRTLLRTEVFIDTDYQKTNGMLFARWSGIQDVESDIIEYRWCIGRAQGTCELKSMTSAGLRTSVYHSIIPLEGLRYFITVEATNGAGFKTAIYSDGIIVDSSPAVLKGVYFEAEKKSIGKSQFIVQTDDRYLEFYWNKATDAESGISSIEWCAGTSNNSCDIVALNPISLDATNVKHYLYEPLASGTHVFVLLMVTNRAELTTTVVTKPLLIDTTPPSVGNVTVGTFPGTVYFKKGDTVKAKWYGFKDNESALDHYEWAVCQATTKGICFGPYVNVGSNTTSNIDVLGIEFGVSYVVVIHAFNKAGLFSEATSNPFIVDNLSPSAGTVYDGLHKRNDIEYQSSASQLSANWSPFKDVNGRIEKYELCIGTNQGSCDVSDFDSVGTKLSGTVIGLSLNHDVKYFVTVRATGVSGYSSIAASNGVKIDTTPPEYGQVRDGETLVDIDYQADDTYIYANWDDFHDKESGVAGYTWCVGTGKGFCDIISPTYVMDQMRAGQQVLEPLPAGIVIFVTVTAVNNVGISSTVSSDGFKVDNTGPILSGVRDLQHGSSDDDIDFLLSKDSYCTRWDAVAPDSGILKSEVSVCSELDSNDCLLRNLDVGNQTFICMADLDFKGGIKYLTKIKAVNLLGVSAEVFSDGFVLDSTPPLMGEVFFAEMFKSTIEGDTKHYTRSVIAAQWRGFWDKESGVRTSYVCLGTTSGKCNTRNFTMVHNTTAYTFADAPLVQGETYFVSVKVENGAGLTSDIQTSEGILFDQTGPTNEGTVLDGNTQGKDVDNQQSRILVAAHWRAFDDLESDVVKLSWCAGLSPGLCDLVKETELINNSTSIRYFLSKPIMNGYRYFVTVKATNGAGVTSLLKSDGVMVDDTPPTSGSVVDGLGSDRNYVNGEDDVSASWSAFMDLESGIDSYKVALCHERNLSNCPQPFTSTGKTTNVTISGLDLERGTQYVFIVRAINHAGLAKETFSDGFTVDFNPPEKGKIWIGAGNEHIIYQADPTKIVVRWSDFMDVESGITKYEVCVSSVPLNCSVTTFVDAGLNTSFTVNGLNLEHGGTYYAIVRGTNAIGLSTENTSGGVLIDLTPPIQKDDSTLSSPSPGNRTDLNASLLQADVSNSSTNNVNGPSITLRCLEEYLTSSWEEFEDRESGMLKYDWCVGTARTLCDVVPMRSVGMKTRGAAIVNSLKTGTVLFSTVYAINGAKLRRQMISKPCTVIAVAPKFTEVIDISSFSSSNLTDTDWKATMQSLSFRWKAIGSYLDEISLLRVQIAVTELSSNLSVPRLLQDKSWNSESLEQPFMDVLSAQHNVTVRSITLNPWMRYRGIVRLWNEGGIFSEASSDGVRMEPSPPETRDLTIHDKAAANEHLRWWPNLRIPPVNKSIVNSDITFISSPAKLELTVHSATSNSTANSTNFILEHDLFSPTADFKIVVKRVTSGGNDTNSTTDSRIMKVIPGFADLEGPCCAKHPSNTLDALSDTHFKPTSPVYEFGVSLAILAEDFLAVGSTGKVLLQSLKNKTARNIVTLSDQSDSNATVKISSYRNTTGFLVNGNLYLYKRTSDDLDGVLGKSIIIGQCKNVPSSNCPESEEWADYLGQSFALNDNVVAVRGTRLSTNSNVVAVFRNMSGKWIFAQTVGDKMKHLNFGQSISLNEHFMAIAAGDGRNCCVMIYSLTTLTLRKTICITDSATKVAPLSLYLTKTNALVVLSKTARLLKVFQLNMTSNSHYEVCRYRAGGHIDELSGNLDVNTREEGFIIAFGFEAMRGGEGLQLLGFQGIYTTSDHSTSSNESSECLNLGSVLARESGLRADSYGTRTSVSFKGDMILFGIPGVLTWPKNDQWLSTGRVYMATYCPVNHFRSTISELQSLRPVACLPCELGRKSFGGFSNACSVCDEKLCFSPPDNESSSFTTDICDDTSCLSTIYLSNKTNGINAHIRRGSLFVSGPENVYSVELLETTRAGKSKSSFSESFMIDATAPVPGMVYDGLGTDQNMNCSENSTYGEDSQCSTRNFEDTDVEFTNNTREIHARWIDFLDNESDIVEYFWCVGTRPMADNIRMCESTGMRPNGSHFGLSLSHGDSYYVTVIACNGARMCSAAHSNGVTIDSTPPMMTYVRDGIMGPDMDFQAFVDIIFAYFAASDEESGVSSYEVAWGTAPGLIDITDFEELINATIWRAKFKDDALEIGRKYYATVRATNGAGLLSDHLSSNGIVVGKSEYVFDNSSKASFFFDTVNVNDDGSRKDGGVGKTYGTLSVPEGAVEEEVKLRCYSLDEKTLEENTTEEGPVSDPKRTAPKQFMLGNYSFQIKALDPINNTVKESFRFAKPIKLTMFYDVDNLVKANKKHVNNEVTEKDIDPVLFLWDPKNETWFDAKLTCPEPWSRVNRSVKLLEVNVCHLTQFAFFFSFQAQHGLLLFGKNHSRYNLDGGIQVSRRMRVTMLEILLRRSKGSQGDIAVQWSLYQNDSSESLDLIWPRSGEVSMKDGQWNDSFILTVENDRRQAPEGVIWVQLENPSGGALLASPDETTLKITIASNQRPDQETGIITTVCISVVSVLVVLVASYVVKRHRNRRKRIVTKISGRQDTEMTHLRDANTGHANNSWRSSDPVDHDMETELNSSGFKPEVEMFTSNPLYESLGLSTDPDVSQVVANPLYGSNNLTGMSGACVIANPLCNSACTLPGADSAPAIENPLYEATSCIEGITGEVNYGENVDEDGSEESFLGKKTSMVEKLD